MQQIAANFKKKAAAKNLPPSKKAKGKAAPAKNTLKINFGIVEIVHKDSPDAPATASLGAPGIPSASNVVASSLLASPALNVISEDTSTNETLNESNEWNESNEDVNDNDTLNEETTNDETEDEQGNDAADGQGLNLSVNIVSGPTTTDGQQGATSSPSESKDPDPEDAEAAAEPTAAAPKPSASDPEVVGLIFTIRQSNSYDALFQSIKQDAPEGECVKVYQVEAAFLPFLQQALLLTNDRLQEIDSILAPLPAGPQKTSISRVLSQVVPEVNDLEPECVVVNFECCSNCSDSGFSQPCAHTHHSSRGHDLSIDFIGQCIAKGNFVMVSDFSLKALMAKWTGNHAVLGRNPFKKLGTFDRGFELRFDREVLQDCPSAQLKVLAEMSTKGNALVHAMSSTVMYGVDHEVAATQTSKYTLDVLTVMTSCGGRKDIKEPRKFMVESGGHTGAAGHVTLTYPSGGVLLTSAGHWIELQKVKTDEKAFFNVMASEYGTSSRKFNMMQSQYAKLSDSAKGEWLQCNAQREVQSRSCSSYSKSKSAWRPKKKKW